MECRRKKIKIIKDVNDDDTLVLSSSEELLEVNNRGDFFYKTMRNIVERTYRHTLNCFVVEMKTKWNYSTHKTR